MTEQTVIAPLPDVMPLKAGMAVKHRLIFEQASRPIAHGMGVFTQNSRLGMGILAKGIHHRHARIHGADHIDHFRIAVFFVMHQPSGIQRLAAFSHGADVAAITGLVAQGPDND
ncbi:hypothetical protein D3C71_1643090 [compost metagenome]